MSQHTNTSSQKPESCDGKGIHSCCRNQDSDQPGQISRADRLIIEAEAKVAEANALNEINATIQFVKSLRGELDGTLQKIKELPSSLELEISSTRLKESIMWLGMELKRLGESNPYPNSYDASNATVDPTADGLKL